MGGGLAWKPTKLIIITFLHTGVYILGGLLSGGLLGEVDCIRQEICGLTVISTAEMLPNFYCAIILDPCPYTLLAINKMCSILTIHKHLHLIKVTITAVLCL